MPTFKSFTLFWLKIGFISFGGPAGQIALMHKEVVEKKKWLEEDRFLQALNYCFFLPGPEAQQLATYIGWSLFGIRGGLVSGLLFILPSFFLLVGLSYVYVTWAHLDWVKQINYALSICVVALVAEAFLRLSRKSLKQIPQKLIALASFLALYFFKIPYPLLILGAAVLGYFFCQSPDSINDQHTNRPKKIIRHFLILVLVFLLLWVVPLLLIRQSIHEDLLTQIGYFFTKLAFVTFGGAYAVLPYMADMAVNYYGWLTQTQMMTGLGLAESTPGPLIMVVTYVGYLAGASTGAAYSGLAGATISTYYTFLPSFFFIFAGAPWINWISQKKYLKSILAGIAASVVGVVLTLALQFGVSVLWPTHDLWKPDVLAFVFGALFFYLLAFRHWSVLRVLLLAVVLVPLINQFI